MRLQWMSRITKFHPLAIRVYGTDFFSACESAEQISRINVAEEKAS